MKLFCITAMATFVAFPAFAQVDHSKMDHSKMDHAQMDHGGEHATHDHARHDHGTHDPAAMDMADAPMNDLGLVLADQPELRAALAAGGQPVVAKVLGAVCDFCATAMNKTFGKREEVAATYVDLDAKTLNLVLKPGHELDDATLTKLVKKAGYKLDAIDRAPALSMG